MTIVLVDVVSETTDTELLGARGSIFLVVIKSIDKARVPAFKHGLVDLFKGSVCRHRSGDLLHGSDVVLSYSETLILLYL